MTLLGETEAQLAGEASYLDGLIALAGEPAGHIADGATWLIKSALESDTKLTAEQVRALCDQLGALPTWGAKLHVCQSLRYLDVPPDDATKLADWVKPLLSHRRPFVRAWSLDALFRLAQQHPIYAADFEAALAAAEQDEAASVRARARHLG